MQCTRSDVDVCEGNHIHVLQETLYLEFHRTSCIWSMRSLLYVHVRCTCIC